MKEFRWARFWRLFRNDVLRLARPLSYGTLALLGLTVTLYLTRFGRAGAGDDPLHAALFGFELVGAGLLLTGISFQDMHHPLERFQYLLLPCSNLERFLSRYLLTGPLFVVYAALAFTLIDRAGNALAGLWIDIQQPRFSPWSGSLLNVVSGYLLAHAVVLTGAICFRTHALLKTVLFLMMLLVSLVLLENLLGRAMFPGAFSWSSFENVEPLPVELLPQFTLPWVNVLAGLGIGAWILYIAFLCLRDHEARDGV